MSKAVLLADLRIILRHINKLPSQGVNSFKAQTIAQVCDQPQQEYLDCGSRLGETPWQGHCCAKVSKERYCSRLYPAPAPNAAIRIIRAAADKIANEDCDQVATYVHLLKAEIRLQQQQ